MKKKICLLTLLIIFLCSGCYDAREIDSMAYLIALGVDKGENDIYRFTYEFAKPPGGEEGGDDKKTDIVVIEAPTFFSAQSKLNKFKSKKANIEHIKVIIFSQEVAKEGVGELVDGFIRPSQMRHNAFVAVARDSAEEFIKKAQPVHEAFTSRYYEHLFDTQYKQTSLETLLYKFYFDMNTKDQDPVMPLVALSKYKDEKDLNNLPEKDRKTDDITNNYIAGELPRTSEEKVEILGAAVFQNDKMITCLTDIESSIYYMLTGVYQKSYFTFLDPFSQYGYVDILLSQNKKPEIKAEKTGDNFYVSINLPLSGELINADEDFYGKKYDELETAFNQRIEDVIYNFLIKATNEWQADILGIGEIAKAQFLTLDLWQKYNWREHYPKTTFNVKVELSMKDSGEYRSGEGMREIW